MENTNLDKEWLQIVKEVRESNISEEEFKAWYVNTKSNNFFKGRDFVLYRT